MAESGGWDDDEEAPPALRQVMQELAVASPAVPMRILPDLTEEQYGDAFNHPGHGKGPAWLRLRLRVLELVGACSTLMSLDLSLCDLTREAEVETLCQGLRSNPVLVDLRLSYNSGFGSENACRHLARVLLSSCSLQVLLLNGVGLTAAGLAHIADAMLSNEHSSLHYLDVSGNRKLGDGGAKSLAQVLSAQFTGLRTLMMYDIGMEQAGAQQLARGLVNNTTLKELFVGDEGSGSSCNGMAPGALTTLLRALANPGPLGDDINVSPKANLVTGPSHLDMLHQNTSITTLDLVLADEKGLGATAARMLRTNSSLRSLSLRHSRFSRMEWRNLFRSLHRNTTLEYLDLHNCKGLDNSLFTELMELLEVNSSLKTINLECTPWNNKAKWIIELLQEHTLMDMLHVEASRDDVVGDDAASCKTDGKEAAEKEALRRNANQAAYLAVLREKLRFVAPKAGRLFICGSGMAGKSTLRKSMVKCSLASSSWLHRVMFRGKSLVHTKQSTCFPPWISRTKSKGYPSEVELLRDDAEMQILVWDMPGQAEVHTLHDYLFPDINQPCVFVFVFSLFDHQTGTVKMEAETDLERELQDWLRVIASSRSASHIPPQVCVVLSHLDRVSGWTQERIVDWASETVDTMRDKFQGVLDLSPTIHAVNSLSGKSVRPLMEHVFACFRDLLSHELPLLPEACTQMSLLLAEWASAHSTHPILREDEFYSLCASKVEALKPLVHGHHPGEDVSEDVREGREAVVAYLHDVGSIIHIPDLKFMIANPNWLAHVFLGRLIRLRDQFQGLVDKRFDGFVYKQDLELVLEEFLKSSKYSGFTTQDLITLMLKLELCYEEPDPTNTDQDSSRFFVPSALEDHNDKALSGLRQLTWPLAHRDNITCIYIGRRLQCADRHRTVLTAGFFPRFQVILRNRLVSKLGIFPEQYKNKRNLISMLVDGIEILVECKGEVGEYVDVLVRSSKSPIQTMDFVREHVVRELHAFCPRACPGVELVEGILRPECVKNLTLCAHREQQAVLVESLKAELMHQLMDEDILYRDHEEIFSLAASLEHEHSFPEEPQANLPEGSHRAVDLLGARDLMKAIDRKLQILSQQRLHIEEAADEVMLRSIQNNLDPKLLSRISLSERQLRLLRRVESSSRGQYSRRSMDAGVQRHSFGDLEVMVENFLRVTKQLDQATAAMDEQKVLMKAILPEVKGIQSLQEDMLRTLMHRMDDVMGFSAQFHQRKMPRLPFFTDSDVGMLQRFSAVMRVGKSVRLHFMCEERSGKHYVEKQEGCEMTLEDGKWRRLRPIAMGAAKLLYIMLRAGLPTVPLPLPVLGASSSMAMDTLLHDIRANELACITPADFSDAWLCLQDFLRPRMDLISSLFELYHIRYTRGEPREVAWVCTACRQKGLNKDILEDYWPH